MAILGKSLERRINALEEQLTPPDVWTVTVSIVPAGGGDSATDGISVRATDLELRIAPSAPLDHGGDPFTRDAPAAPSTPAPEPAETRMRQYL